MVSHVYNSLNERHHVRRRNENDLRAQFGQVPNVLGKLYVVANQKAKALALEFEGHIRVARRVERVFVRAEQLDLAVACQPPSILGKSKGRVEQPVFSVFRQSDGQAHIMAPTEVGDVIVNFVPRLRPFTWDGSVPGKKCLGKDQHVSSGFRGGRQGSLYDGHPLLHAPWLRGLIKTDDHGSDAFRTGQINDEGASIAGRGIVRSA